MSDQDFFFDEDESPAEETKETKKATKTSGTAPKKATQKPAAPAPSGEKSVTMTIASLIGVVALLVGIIIGILIPAGGTGNVPAPTTPTGVDATAPQLSPEQLEGGQLPEGHPDLGDAEQPPATEATGTE